MKNLKIIFLAFVAIFLMSIPQAQALKRVLFPDSKTLQPMPGYDVRPNISGNVNSTAGPINIGNPETSANAAPENNNQPDSSRKNPSPVEPEAKNASATTWVWIIGVIIVIAVASVAFIFKKTRKL